MNIDLPDVRDIVGFRIIRQFSSKSWDWVQYCGTNGGAFVSPRELCINNNFYKAKCWSLAKIYTDYEKAKQDVLVLSKYPRWNNCQWYIVPMSKNEYEENEKDKKLRAEYEQDMYSWLKKPKYPVPYNYIRSS